MKAYFGEYGTVVDAVVKMEVDTYGSAPGKSRGFGFVKFLEADAVKSVSCVMIKYTRSEEISFALSNVCVS